MDVIILDKNCIKLKGKTTSILINPSDSMNKSEAEAVIVPATYQGQSFPKVEGLRIIIKGPGEYEVNGVKITAFSGASDLVSFVDMDGLKILAGNGLSIEKIQDKIEECHIAVINADSEFNYSVLSTIEPRVILVYGEKKGEVAKQVGKDNPEKVSKFSTTYEKLPAELQMLLLE